MQKKKTKPARRSKLTADELTAGEPAADELACADIWQRVERGPGRPPRFERVLVWLPATSARHSRADRLNKT